MKSQLLLVAGLLIAGGLILINNKLNPQVQPVRFDVAPTGTFLVSTEQGRFFLFAPESQRLTELSPPPTNKANPALSPDGKHLVYDAGKGGNNSNHIFVYSIDGATNKQITNEENVYDMAPSFTPDGSEILFFRAHSLRPYSMGGSVWDEWDIYRMKPDGSQLQRVTHQNYITVTPNINCVNDTIIFCADRKGDPSTKVYITSLKNRQAPKALATGVEPALSPDGKTIAYISDRVKRFEFHLYLIDVSGGHDRQITQGGETDKANPVFSPNGQHIYFLSTATGNQWSISRIDISGNNQQLLVKGDLFKNPAAR